MAMASSSDSRGVAHCLKNCFFARLAPVPEVMLKVQTEEKEYSIKLSADGKVAHLMQRVMYLEGYWPNTPANLEFFIQTPEGVALPRSTFLSDLQSDSFVFVVEQVEAEPPRNVFSGRRCGKCACTVSSVCAACQELPSPPDTLVRFRSRISCQSGGSPKRTGSRLAFDSSTGSTMGSAMGFPDSLVRLNSKLSDDESGLSLTEISAQGVSQ